ncbi:hypothetical protein Dthio_PD0395 [Desulfonatronospira thiodismutans ASO3-1]|uniref:Uncharacterized protein n=1 Tax=Desulfonatronospira thiodismutans ASO3-1 TaxID=555779 RepID=D6SUV1_9BACT|nr:hypothetical protein Dthio_PD0395 [Desulfonatronospira thiodismutans ASO3-1]
MNAMGINRVPSAEACRQNFQELALNKDLQTILTALSIKLWKKSGAKNEYIEKDQMQWAGEWVHKQKPWMVCQTAFGKGQLFL